MSEVLVDLSHPFGNGSPLWPYFADVKIERMHYLAKSGVLVPDGDHSHALHDSCRLTSACL